MIHENRLRVLKVLGAFAGTLLLFQNCAQPFSADLGSTEQHSTPAPAELVLSSGDLRIMNQVPALAGVSEAIEKSLDGMPAELNTVHLTPSQKALRLQWILKAANESPVKSVEIVLDPGQYDFSKVMGSHPSTPDKGGARGYMPKLYIARNHITIRGSQSTTNPTTLFYRGPGNDGQNHGRVVLMVQSGLNNVHIEGIHFEGDHSASEFRNGSYYAHENNAALRETEYQNVYNYGLVKVGYTGGASKVTIKNCIFSRINYHGLDIVGTAEVINSEFRGAVPVPSSDAYFSNLLEVSDIVFERNGSRGMAYSTGIFQYGNYGGSKIINSRFKNLVEGIFGSGFGPGTEFTGNNFLDIADHGIYLIGVRMEGALISRNSFVRMFGQSIKLAGTNPSGSDPLDKSLNLRGIRVQQNTFRANRREIIEAAGAFNTIRDNVIYSYSSADDPSGYYNPERDPRDHRPDIRLSHRNGGVNYWNHVSFNLVANNQVYGNVRKFEIFLQQYHDTPETEVANDRSVGFNYFAGSQQKIFLKSKLNSRYAPVVLLSGSELTLAPLPNCSNCSSDAPGYRSTLAIDWTIKVKAGSKSGYLLKYREGADIYFIGPNGEHQRVNPPGRVFKILGAADLNGDGWDEIYSVESGPSYDVIYSAGPGSELPQTAVARPGGRLSAYSFSNSLSPRIKLYAVFSNDLNLAYYTGLRDDGLAHVIRYAYPLNGASLPRGKQMEFVSSTELTGDLGVLFLRLFSAN